VSEQIVHRAAALHALGDYAGTVRFVRENEHMLTDESRMPALREAFLAARDGRMDKEARQLAADIAVEEPDLPTIQPYLR
jgi:hypothetical protein